MILPIRTSIRPWRTPYANYALIVVNAVIFLLTYWSHTDPFTGNVEVLRPWAEQFMLVPVRPFLWQFVSYAFLHGGLLHIEWCEDGRVLMTGPVSTSFEGVLNPSLLAVAR